MNIAQTIGTVISAVETSPEILAQVQDVIAPIVVFTLEKQLIGNSPQPKYKDINNVPCYRSVRQCVRTH